MENTLITSLPPTLNPLPELDRVFCLQGYSYGERAALLPELTHIFAECGGWVLERRTTSPATTEFRLELQLRGIPELYASLAGAGIELTRASHTTLTTLCTCRRHSAHTVRLAQVITLNLEISFLEDVTLHSLLMTGTGLA